MGGDNDGHWRWIILSFFWTLPRNGGIGLRSNPDHTRQTVKMQIPKGVTMGISEALMTLFFSQEEKKKSGLAKGVTAKKEGDKLKAARERRN